MPITASENREPFWRVRKPYAGHLENSATRQIYLLNNDWDYLEQNIKSISELGKNNFIWQKINLPHSWNRFDATDNIPGYRREASWYRKSLYIPQFDENVVFGFTLKA
jgi:hypothetical protein